MTLIGILFFVLVGLQIITIIPLPSKIPKTKWQLFVPVVSLLLYIRYEHIMLSTGNNIRVDLGILHPLIITAFITSIIRSILMWKNRKINVIYLIVVISSFLYWLYYIYFVCLFYHNLFPPINW
ncbi:MAG: hypothetical protein PHE88_10020 [Elusimicrobia bacterium]|nr:hypothetical protein [Elusimicrobiota bacterium]